MIWTVDEIQINEDAQKHAGGKAREDLSRIFSDAGISRTSVPFPQSKRDAGGIVGKLKDHLAVAKAWHTALRQVKRGDILVLQFPAVNHTLFLGSILRRVCERGVEVYAFIHDLEYLRMSNDESLSIKTRWRMKKEELDELRFFKKIIVHNSRMKNLMIKKLGIREDKLEVLGIFDYLTPDGFEAAQKVEKSRNCIIAGNLKKSKSGYVYNLPKSPEFELYGINFEGTTNNNIHYQGSYLADELPFHMSGGFGLVWDGDSTETCSGAWGEYLRYNNPHKTSLYLACGIPVIIWEEAALADFVLENEVGIAVKSLQDVDQAISSLSDGEYREMKENAIRLSEKLRNGENTKRALQKIGVVAY